MSKYYVVVLDDNGWSDGCDDWQGVFFGSLPGYSDEYRGIGCDTKAGAEKVKRQLDSTGDWTIPDTNDIARPTYTIALASAFVSETSAIAAEHVLRIFRATQ